MLEEQLTETVVPTKEPTEPSGDKGKEQETTPEKSPVLTPIHIRKTSFCKISIIYATVIIVN